MGLARFPENGFVRFVMAKETTNKDQKNFSPKFQLEIGRMVSVY